MLPVRIPSGRCRRNTMSDEQRQGMPSESSLGTRRPKRRALEVEEPAPRRIEDVDIHLTKRQHAVEHLGGAVLAALVRECVVGVDDAAPGEEAIAEEPRHVGVLAVQQVVAIEAQPPRLSDCAQAAPLPESESARCWTEKPLAGLDEIRHARDAIAVFGRSWGCTLPRPAIAPHSDGTMETGFRRALLLASAAACPAFGGASCRSPASTRRAA